MKDFFVPVVIIGAGIGSFYYYYIKKKNATDKKYFTTHFEHYKDVITFEVDKDLLRFELGSPISTPWQSVIGLKGFQWKLNANPVLFDYNSVLVSIETNENSLNVCIAANLVILNTSVEIPFTDKHAVVKLNQLENKDSFDDEIYIFRVTCVLTMPQVMVKVIPSLPAAPPKLTTFDGDDSDAVLIVDKKQINVHRGLLSMFSPVFRAMFNHDTHEAKTGAVVIKDLDYETVFTAIEYIYGRKNERLSIEEIIRIYLFADKYCIEKFLSILEIWLMEHLDVKHFCYAVKSTWISASPMLKSVMAQLYYTNMEYLTLTDEFIQLPHDIMVELMKGAQKFRP